ncbi:MAG: uroporphyrinogen decarboxylase family protein [Armatimonadota bacterium]
MQTELTPRQRFLNVMEYQPVDRVPNHEVGVWPQTWDRWIHEGMNPAEHSASWFWGDPGFNLDPREYVRTNYQMVPLFEPQVIEITDKYETIRNGHGIVTKALREGTLHGGRMSMDQYISFPVTDLASFRELKKRYIASDLVRQPAGWRENDLERWKNRENVLILGENCQTLGFYWRAREWMGTEGISYAFFEQPELVHEMMEFVADFTIEVSRPFVEAVDFDYVFINEDMAMKSGPLLGPNTYKEFIWPHMRRVVEFFKSHGTRYVLVDSDGNPDPLIPLLMDAGVDGIWPMERASLDTDPIRLRKKFGKQLRLWGGVDKRELSKDRRAIDNHLRTFIPLIEQGGFIPTVDHTVPPDISWENFCYYMERKMELLRGELK